MATSLAEPEVAAKMAAKAKNGTHGWFLRMVSREHLVAPFFKATFQLYKLVSISSLKYFKHFLNYVEDKTKVMSVFSVLDSQSSDLSSNSGRGIAD